MHNITEGTGYQDLKVVAVNGATHSLSTSESSASGSYVDVEWVHSAKGRRLERVPLHWRGSRPTPHCVEWEQAGGSFPPLTG